jgi:hypothetical protein
MSDRVDRAARITRIYDWCLDDAGERLPQTTQPDLVWAMLRMLKERT